MVSRSVSACAGATSCTGRPAWTRKWTRVLSPSEGTAITSQASPATVPKRSRVEARPSAPVWRTGYTDVTVAGASGLTSLVYTTSTPSSGMPRSSRTTTTSSCCG